MVTFIYWPIMPAMKPCIPFQFKQFTVYQASSAMKVTLDACLFGALVRPREFDRTALDIGAGTGLLSLMLAQHGFNQGLTVDGVEIDPAAALEATSNADNSPFQDKVFINNCSIEAFACDKKYDLIISNPPFFSAHLLATNPSRNQARHNDSLPFSTLAKQIALRLASNGKAWVLLPCNEMDTFLKHCTHHQLQCCTIWGVASKESLTPYRSIACLAVGEPQSTDQRSIVVRNEDESYTEEFKALLRPFYMKL